MTSIPTPFIFGVRFLQTVIKNIAITVRETGHESRQALKLEAT